MLEACYVNMVHEELNLKMAGIRPTLNVQKNETHIGICYWRVFLESEGFEGWCPLVLCSPRAYFAIKQAKNHSNERVEMIKLSETWRALVHDISHPSGPVLCSPYDLRTATKTLHLLDCQSSEKMAFEMIVTTAQMPTKESHKYGDRFPLSLLEITHNSKLLNFQ